eukprot:1160752-Pelagomonas_calceolata.AAC.1
MKLGIGVAVYYSRARNQTVCPESCCVGHTSLASWSAAGWHTVCTACHSLQTSCNSLDLSLGPSWELESAWPLSKTWGCGIT